MRRSLLLLALVGCADRAQVQRDCSSRLSWARTWPDSQSVLESWNVTGLLVIRCGEVMRPDTLPERPK